MPLACWQIISRWVMRRRWDPLDGFAELNGVKGNACKRDDDDYPSIESGALGWSVVWRSLRYF